MCLSPFLWFIRTVPSKSNVILFYDKLTTAYKALQAFVLRVYRFSILLTELFNSDIFRFDFKLIFILFILSFFSLNVRHRMYIVLVGLYFIFNKQKHEMTAVSVSTVWSVARSIEFCCVKCFFFNDDSVFVIWILHRSWIKSPYLKYFICK